jgi:phage FluMu protein Com
MGEFMKFRCPECGNTLKVANEMAGKKGRCPSCKAVVKAPRLKKRLDKTSIRPSQEPSSLPALIHTFNIIRQTGKKQIWQLSLYADRLILHYPEAGTLVEVLRDQAIHKLKTAKLFLILPVLIVKGLKKFTYRIKANEYEVINEWIGKPQLLKKTLNQRFRWCLPIGFFYMLTSLPLSEDPAAGLEEIPFDPMGMILGLALFVLSFFMKKKPHPSLFVADSVCFFLLLCYTLFQIHSGANVYWGIVIPLFIILIITGMSHYRYFSGIQKGQG